MRTIPRRQRLQRYNLTVVSGLIELSARAGIRSTKNFVVNNYDHILSLLAPDRGLNTSFCDGKKALLTEQKCYRSRICTNGLRTECRKLQVTLVA